MIAFTYLFSHKTCPEMGGRILFCKNYFTMCQVGHRNCGLHPNRDTKGIPFVNHYFHTIEEGPSLHNPDYQISDVINLLAVTYTKCHIYIDFFALLKSDHNFIILTAPVFLEKCR